MYNFIKSPNIQTQTVPRYHPHIMLNKAYDKHNPYERVKRTIAEEAGQLPLSFGQRKRKNKRKKNSKRSSFKKKKKTQKLRNLNITISLRKRLYFG